MPEPTVRWRDDGTPVSPRYGDIYRSAGDGAHGGLAQARHVFLRGCGLLPDAGEAAVWAGAPRWAVLETGFGLGLNFLATWTAWRFDAARPQRLFYSAVEAHLVEPQDLLRSAAPYPELHALADELARQWHGLLPGVHRLAFDDERVQLTLAVGEAGSVLPELTGAHDAIYFDGFNPALNPQMWSLPVLKAVARLARRGARAASWCVAREVRERLVTCGFEVERVSGLPPKRHALRAQWLPRWDARPRADAEPTVGAPGHCAVIGGGLAGASVAWSLAQRGWRVTVLDRASQPAAGASALPAGVVAPHVSPDDRPLSRLSRAGARATLARAALLLRAGEDFAASGVLERHEAGKRRLPADWAAITTQAARAETLDADDPRTQQQAGAAGVPIDAHRRALWHARAGWVRPAALVRALLRAPGIEWRGDTAVARLEREPAGWCLLDAHGQPIERADLVVVAAGFDSQALAGGGLPLHPLRGQVAHGPMPGGGLDAALPPFPVNGHGSLIAHLPGAGGACWVTGSTFERACAQPTPSDADHAANRARLAELLPDASAALDAQWPDGRAACWAGVRATLPDRLPAVGAWAPADDQKFKHNQPPTPIQQALPAMNSIEKTEPLALHLCTGLGARGLTLAVLCGELLAATLHGEPLPVARSLAAHLRASRFVR